MVKVSTETGYPVNERRRCKLCENFAIKRMMMYKYYMRDILW